MKKTVLICDDDKDILNVCRIILERENYHVKTYTDCESVLSEIKAVEPDVILMDIWVPAMGGEALTRLIKEDEATKHISVILFSANDEIKKITERVQADGYIHKPFDVKTLVKIIEKYAGHNKPFDRFNNQALQDDFGHSVKKYLNELVLGPFLTPVS